MNCCSSKGKNSDAQYDQVHTLSNLFKRISVVTSLVNEGRRYSAQTKPQEKNNSSSEEEHDTEVVKDYRRRRSSAFNFNQIPLQSLRTENFKTLNENEAIN